MSNLQRRHFLKKMALGTASAALVDSIIATDAVFANALDQIRQPDIDFSRLRGQYMLDEGVSYLNHGSIGTIARPVHDAHVGYLATCESNPWYYMWGGGWEAAREEVRSKVGALLNCDPDTIAITHNTTEVFNLLAHGLPLGAGDEVLFSTLNHDGASVAFEHRAAAKGYSVRRFGFV